MLRNAHNIVKKVGVITHIFPDSDRLLVKLSCHSACQGCRAKAACGQGESVEKIVELSVTDSNYKVGDSVNVVMAQSLGVKAILYGYFFPFLLVVTSLFISYHFFGREDIAAIVALSSLVPYYGALFLLRDKLKKVFYFYIERVGGLGSQIDQGGRSEVGK